MMRTTQAMLTMAAAVGAATTAQAQSATPVPALQGTRLDIVAEGSVTRTPDIATINAGVVTQAPTARAAMTDNAGRMTAVVAALKQAGVADRDIQTSTLSLQPQYRYDDNKPPVITGYKASNQVSVRFRDVKRAGPILDALVAQGANQIQGPHFGLDQPEAALDEARTAAMRTARDRANLYATAAGLKVKRILAIREQGGGYQPPMPMPVMAMRAEKAADTAIEPGEQKLSITLNVSFELE